jgi:hypothetical protein
MIKRLSGEIKKGTRQDEWFRILPPINTFIWFLICVIGSLVGSIYMRDREVVMDLATNVNTLSIVIGKRFDETQAKFEDNQQERWRLVEKNEDDKKQIREQIADLRAQCCVFPGQAYRRTR